MTMNMIYYTTATPDWPLKCLHLLSTSLSIKISSLLSTPLSSQSASTMDLAMLLVALAFAASYLFWFYNLLPSLRHGPRVWPLLGSLPGLVHNAERMHDWIAANLQAAGGTYQTCICAVPFLARRQGLVTVTCDPRNLEHILKNRFDNYPKGPTWHAVFHELLGDGIFNSDGETWLLQRKTAALEFTTRTLRIAMSRWLSEIHLAEIHPHSAVRLRIQIQRRFTRLAFSDSHSTTSRKRS